MPQPSLSDVPWLDRPDAFEQIAARRANGTLSELQATKLTQYARDGFVDLGNLVPEALCRELRDEVTALVRAHQGQHVVDWYEALQNMYRTSDTCRRATLLPEVLAWCDLVLGTRALPFQTLSIPEGTQIPAHSDQVLMSTQPTGYLVVAWLALEDIHPDSGPLTLWKGSHRFPYLRPSDYGVPPGTPRPEATRLHSQNYYPAIQHLLDERRPEPFVYLPKQGDVLLWHSNVLHRGAVRKHPSMSRHSLVVHYFGEGVRTFSDLFSEPCALPDLR